MKMTVYPIPDRILILAPHSDDESLGCGGLLQLYGDRCDVIILTDGRNGHKNDIGCEMDAFIRKREEESRKALKMTYSGIQPIFLRIPDGELYKNKRAVRHIELRKYDWVLVPNKMESHKDHRVVKKIISSLKRKQRASCTIVEYEVWTPILRPTFFLDITDVADKKREMIKCYRSQLEDVDYVEHIMALNYYRGIYYDMKYAEAYYVNNIRENLKDIYYRLPFSLQDFINRFRG